MSVWKKASKANQKTHRERHQPQERQHLGLLEKKKDYKKRANDFNEKKATLKLLRKRALNRNPDEFYHHMINSKIEDGFHIEKDKEAEDTPEQLQLMRSQDLKYIAMKRNQEAKKIERLQSQLHLSGININKRNKHKYFGDNLEEVPRKRNSTNECLKKSLLPDVDLLTLKQAAVTRKSLYKQLGKRIERERELTIVQRKLEMAKCLEDKKSVLPPKRIKRGNASSAPIYKWKYERKR